MEHGLPRPTSLRALAMAFLAVVAALGTTTGGAAEDDLPFDAKAPPPEPVVVTTELRPGWNLAGWTGAEATVGTVFSAVPEVLAVYSWDAAEQRFLFAVREGGLGDLTTLAPGMGLMLYVEGTRTVAWQRPHVPESLRVPLEPGWNMVAWAGVGGTAAEDALTDLRPILTGAGHWNVSTQEVETPARFTHDLRRGSALWVSVSEEMVWRQVPVPLWIEFSPEQSGDERAAAVASIERDIDFFVHRYEVLLPNATVEFDAELASCGVYQSPKVVVLKPGCEGALVHEYTHALQSYLSSRAPSGDWGDYIRGPAWLTEGMANHFAATRADHMGYRSFDRHVRNAVVGTAGNPLQLADLEENILTEVPGGTIHLNYHMASLAVLWIIDHAGEPALWDYYRGLRSVEASWQDVFEDTFGLAVNDFYREFEAYRPPFTLASRFEDAADSTPFEERGLGELEAVIRGPDGLGMRLDFVELETLGRLSQQGFGGYSTYTDAAGRLSQEIVEGSYVLSIREYGCVVGWYGGPTGFTRNEHEAAVLKITANEVTRVTMDLPWPPSQVCKRISGSVVDSQGAPTAPDLVLEFRPHHGRAYSGGLAPARGGRFATYVKPGTGYEVWINSFVVEACLVEDHTFDGTTTAILVAEEDISGVRVIVVTGPEREDTAWVRCTPAEAP